MPLKRTLGFSKGQFRVGDEFFYPLSGDELAQWEGDL